MNQQDETTPSTPSEENEAESQTNEKVQQPVVDTKLAIDGEQRNEPEPSVTESAAQENVLEQETLNNLAAPQIDSDPDEPAPENPVPVKTDPVDTTHIDPLPTDEEISKDIEQSGIPSTLAEKPSEMVNTGEAQEDLLDGLEGSVLEPDPSEQVSATNLAESELPLSETAPEPKTAEKNVETVQTDSDADKSIPQAEEEATVHAQLESKEPVSKDENEKFAPQKEVAEEPEDLKKHKIKPRKLSYAFNKMVANFAGCGRCSYFLAGYRVLHGELVIDKAVKRMMANQVQLPWDDEMRKLLVNAYGIHFDVDFLGFNGRCSECGRVFTYKDNLNPDKPSTTFTIQFNFKKN